MPTYESESLEERLARLQEENDQYRLELAGRLKAFDAIRDQVQAHRAKHKEMIRTECELRTKLGKFRQMVSDAWDREAALKADNAKLTKHLNDYYRRLQDQYEQLEAFKRKAEARKTLRAARMNRILERFRDSLQLEEGEEL